MKTTVANGLWQSRYLIFLVCYFLVQVQSSENQNLIYQRRDSPEQIISKPYKANTAPPTVNRLNFKSGPNKEQIESKSYEEISVALNTCTSEKENIEARYDTLFQVAMLLFMIIFAMVIYFKFIISNNNVNEKLPSQLPSQSTVLISQNIKKNLPPEVKIISEDLVLQAKEIGPDIMKRSSLNMSAYNNILQKHFRKTTPRNSSPKNNKENDR